MLVRLFRFLRRAARAALGPVSAAALMALATTRPDLRALVPLALATLVGMLDRVRIHRAHARLAPGTVPIDTSVALGAIALAWTALALTGGRTLSPLAPLPLLALLAANALGTRGAAVLATLFALLAESLAFVTEAPLALHVLAIRCALVAGAAVLEHVLVRTEILRVRTAAARLLEAERRDQHESARAFRLLDSARAASHGAHVDDARRVRSSLDEIDAAMDGLLDVARRALALDACVLYWLDRRGTSLRAAAANVDDSLPALEPVIAVGAGTIGHAFAFDRTVSKSDLAHDDRDIGYAGGMHAIRNFAAYPLHDEGAVCGVITAARRKGDAFSDDELDVLAAIGQQTVRVVRNERVFGQVERSKDALAKLFAASRALADALSETQVIDALMAAVHTVVEHDATVFATYDARTHEHRVKRASGEGTSTFEGLSFGDNTGLVTAAAALRQPAPHRGHFDARAGYVFTPSHTFAGYESVLAVPLVSGERTLATVTLAAHRRGAFGDAVRQLLGVLAGHAAIALANAAAVHRLEELATTDPMTGLLNKRALEGEFERRLRSSERFERPLAVIIADIDLFKTVNDTYGHATGDVVIKGLGAVLARCKRETDVVARFGGEEFVLVCEQTDLEGARQLAERIRTEFASTVFATGSGPLTVTCSLGVAEFPRDGNTRDALFERADAGLYEAKRTGRNRTCTPPGTKRKADVSRTTVPKRGAKADTSATG